MRKNNYFLTSGVFLLCFALFQLSAIFWNKEMLIYFGGPVRLQQENPLAYSLVCIFVAVIVAIAGIYSFSGAGQFRRLPFLRTMLITITVVFILRGLSIISDIIIIMQRPNENLIRFAVYSAIALVIGLIHLAGVIRFYKQKRKENQVNK